MWSWPVAYEVEVKSALLSLTQETVDVSTKEAVEAMVSLVRLTYLLVVNAKYFDVLIGVR